MDRIFIFQTIIESEALITVTGMVMAIGLLTTYEVCRQVHSYYNKKPPSDNPKSIDSTETIPEESENTTDPTAGQEEAGDEETIIARIFYFFIHILDETVVLENIIKTFFKKDN